MKGYGQFCPVAKATEILGERWTILVIRELLNGPAGFNDIRHGVPLMSPSLLSTRLKTLCDAGLIQREKSAAGVHYRLTEGGEELRPIILQLGLWGLRWTRSDFSRKDLDPGLLMWDMRRNLDARALGPGRTVLRFEFRGQASRLRYWWLIVDDGDVDMCLKDPGHEVDLYVSSDLSTMCRVWMGELEPRQAVADGRIQLTGPRRLQRGFPHWLGRGLFAYPERVNQMVNAS